MTNSPNPYRPMGEPTVDPFDDDLVRFDGSVSIDDIVRLIHSPKLLLALRIFYIGTLAPFLAMGIGSLVLKTGSRAAASGMLGGIMVLAGMFIFADLYLSRRNRAKRLVRQHPDLLGPISGQLTRDGLVTLIQQPQLQLTITWGVFQDIVVNQHGIRLQYQGQEGLFLPIPAQCIDGFDAKSTRRLVDQLRRSQPSEAVVRTACDWTEAPLGAIHYEVFVNASETTTSHVVDFPKWKWLIWGIVLLSLFVLLLYLFDAASLVVFLIIATLAVGLGSMWHLRFTDGITHQYWGWFTADGIRTVLPGDISQRRWSEMKSIDIGDERLLLTFENGGGVSIEPSDLRSGSWSQLKAWAKGNEPSS